MEKNSYENGCVFSMEDLRLAIKGCRTLQERKRESRLTAIDQGFVLSEAKCGNIVLSKKQFDSLLDSEGLVLKLTSRRQGMEEANYEKDRGTNFMGYQYDSEILFLLELEKGKEITFETKKMSQPQVVLHYCLKFLRKNLS
jgi:hypothetical protein